MFAKLHTPLLSTLLAITVCAQCKPVGPVKPTARSCIRLPEIRFAEHLCAKLAANRKQITLRSRHRRQIAVGQWVQLRCLQSNRRFLARVTAIRHTTWQQISAEELKDDGFVSRDQMLRIMRRYYPGIEWHDRATVYRWDTNRPCSK